MAPGVIADEVSGVGDAANELRLGLGKLADHEERGAHIVLGEDVEQTRRPGGVGAVVEGEGELAGAARRDERPAKDLRGGPQGGIGEPADAKPGCAGDAECPVNTRCQRRKHCCQIVCGEGGTASSVQQAECAKRDGALRLHRGRILVLFGSHPELYGAALETT